MCRTWLFSTMWIKKVNPFIRLDIERRCSMLFPILQYVWQQIGPLVQQASPQIISAIQKLPPYIMVQGGRYVSQSVFSWYQSLTPEEIERLQNAVFWVAKDLAGDVAAAATGLPIGPFVDMAVENVLDKLGHDNASQEEVTYIQSELLRQLNKS